MDTRKVIRNDALIHASKVTYTTARSKLKVVCYVLYSQKAAGGGAAMPCVIFLRGGNRELGALTQKMVTSKSILTLLASEHFFVVAPQYPGVDGGEGADGFGSPDDVDSVTSLINVIKHDDFRHLVDPASIGIVGVSRGGAMAYQVMRAVRAVQTESAEHADWLKAVVVLAGPVDQKAGWEKRPVMKKIAQELYGATEQGAVDRSVIKWYRELPTVPLLVIQGGRDEQVDAMGVLRFVRRLTKIGHPFQFSLHGTLGHHLLSSREVKKNTVDWLREHIYDKPGELS